MNFSIFCYKKSCAFQKYQEELVPISSHLVLVDLGINFQVSYSFVRYLLITCQGLSRTQGVYILIHRQTKNKQMITNLF